MVTTVRKKMWPLFPLGPWPPSRTRVLASGEVAVTEESYPPAGRAPLQAVGSLATDMTATVVPLCYRLRGSVCRPAAGGGGTASDAFLRPLPPAAARPSPP